MISGVRLRSARGIFRYPFRGRKQKWRGERTLGNVDFGVRSEAIMVDQISEERIAKSDPSARTTSRSIFGYALSVVSVALATGATFLLEGYTFRTPLFFPAILLTTWFSGTGPGLFAVLLSTLSINFFFLEPRFAFSFGPHDIPHLAVFFFPAFLVSPGTTIGDPPSVTCGGRAMN